MEKQNEIVKVRGAVRHTKNPFAEGLLTIKKGKSTIISGNTKKVLVDTNTGEIEGVALLHRYKTVDREQFVKLFVAEVSSLFDLSKSGLKVFGYILHIIPVNKDEIFIHMPDLVTYCGWTQYNTAYKGLGELMANKIIAMSAKHGHWFINPNILFNGDRIAFIKEYSIKHAKQEKTQLNAFNEDFNEQLSEE